MRRLLLLVPSTWWHGSVPTRSGAAPHLRIDDGGHGRLRRGLRRRRARSRGRPPGPGSERRSPCRLRSVPSPAPEVELVAVLAERERKRPPDHFFFDDLPPEAAFPRFFDDVMRSRQPSTSMATSYFLAAFVMRFQASARSRSETPST